MNRGTILLAAVLLAILGLAVWGLTAAWKLGGDVSMSIHGYIALGLAFVVTGVVGGGLMWLAFYSSRHGFDDIDRDDH